MFDRYAFDLTRFSNMAKNVPQTVRDRYIWDLMWPAANDSLYVQRPGQYRSELHDRILASRQMRLDAAVRGVAYPPRDTEPARLIGRPGA